MKFPHRGLKVHCVLILSTVFEATPRTSENRHQQGHLTFQLGQCGKALSSKLPRACLFYACSCCLSWRPVPIKWKINEMEVFSPALGDHFILIILFPQPTAFSLSYTAVWYYKLCWAISPSQSRRFRSTGEFWKSILPVMKCFLFWLNSPRGRKKWVYVRVVGPLKITES